MRMNISPLVVYLVLLAIAVLFALLVLEAAVFWLPLSFDNDCAHNDSLLHSLSWRYQQYQ